MIGYPPFIWFIMYYLYDLYIVLYDECSEGERGEYSSAKYTMQDQETFNKKLWGLTWCTFFKKLSDLTPGRSFS